MAKKLVICCDGTWNRQEERVNGEIRRTNVLKVARALLPTDRNGVPQIVYYDRGVGTAGLWDKCVGGACGVGLSNHVKDAYRFIANNYAEGDEIFCFGFSRGAYTVRSLSGLIGSVGLLDKNQLEYLPEAYEYYRTPPAKRPASKYKDAAVVRDPARKYVRITFMGVWDMVGALGIPVRGLRRLSRYWVGFHNTELSGNIGFAYQALAVDEERRPFAPDLWTTVEEKAQVKHDRRGVLQVWFVGVHSNVGGGYADSRLSDVALEWMVTRAEECGLVFGPQFFQEKAIPDPVNGRLFDSFKWPFSWVSPRYVRPIGLQQIDEALPGVNEMIHESVSRRIANGGTTYRPRNVIEAQERGIPEFNEAARRGMGGELRA